MPKPPDIDAEVERIERRVEQYIERKVRPYLQHLLDKAQRRMHRHRLGFVDGMGTSFFTIDDEASNWLSDAVCLDCGQHKERYRNAFPELVEFYDIVLRMSDPPFKSDVGDMDPS